MAKKIKYTGENYPWTNYMTLEEWTNFTINFLTFRENKNISWYLIYMDFDFNKFIGGAFSWCMTPEGVDYWHKISQRKEPIIKR